MKITPEVCFAVTAYYVASIRLTLLMLLFFRRLLGAQPINGFSVVYDSLIVHSPSSNYVANFM